jgi:hypothetical protein
MNQQFNISKVVFNVLPGIRLICSYLDWIINFMNAEKCETIKESSLNFKGYSFKLDFFWIRFLLTLITLDDNTAI